eukprot:TRINITY_DN12078_c0_g1_i1.p1 TRINITY_DN12078_c0_g1~~TRINITY_DN12078_c0_g1_i1.p1  ORF type:complete len:206 (-),score=67.66 TRINITY_DN12078_c0_g1_i1:184-801(-)
MMEATANVEIKDEKFIDEKKKYFESIQGELEKMSSMQERFYTEFNGSSSDKENTLKKLSDDILRMETHLFNMIRRSTDNLREELEINSQLLSRNTTASNTTTTNTAQFKLPDPTTTWDSLFKMFTDWNSNEDGRAGSKNPRLKSIDDEIATIRGAIHQLNNRKKLSEKDEEILKELKENLRKKMNERETISSEIKSSEVVVDMKS